MMADYEREDWMLEALRWASAYGWTWVSADEEFVFADRPEHLKVIKNPNSEAKGGWCPWFSPIGAVQMEAPFGHPIAALKAATKVYEMFVGEDEIARLEKEKEEAVAVAHLRDRIEKIKSPPQAPAPMIGLNEPVTAHVLIQRVQCERCGLAFDSPASNAGRVALCGGCGIMIRFPEINQTEPFRAPSKVASFLHCPSCGVAVPSCRRGKLCLKCEVDGVDEKESPDERPLAARVEMLEKRLDCMPCPSKGPGGRPCTKPFGHQADGNLAHTNGDFGW